MLVAITESDSRAINDVVGRDFVQIVRQLVDSHLSRTPLSDISFQKHDVRDSSGMETSSNATFPEGIDGRSNFTLDRVVENYTIGALYFTDHEMVLDVGYYMNPRKVRLPITRFPELQLATAKERRLFSMHKHNTVIYWPKLRVKLVARDVLLHGLSTEAQLDNVSERDFIYETPSPALT